MAFAAGRYRRHLLLPGALFLGCGVLSIITRQYWLMAIPFAWILSVPVFRYLVQGPENFFWLIFMLLPVSAEITITAQLGLDFPVEPVLILLTVLTAIKLLHEPECFPRSLSLHPLFFILVIYTGWILITCFYSTEPWLSFKYLLAKTWYIIPLVVLPQKMISDKAGLRRLALCLLVPMLFVVLQALVRHASYGFTFESVKWIYGPFFRNHVTFSAMLVCLLALAWCVWKTTPAANPARTWIGYGIIAGIAALVFAYSRGAWGALLLGIVSAWAIRKKIMGWMIGTAVLAVVISVVWLVTDNRFMRFAPEHDTTVFHTDFGAHMQATLAMKDVSTAERFYRWVAGAKMLAEKPATGFGPNTFYPHYFRYTVKDFETWVSNNPDHSTVHNYFLLVTLEQGIAGLAGFCILFFGMILYTQRLYHRLQDHFYKTIALTVGVILVMIGTINFMSDMIETDKIGGLFWLCLGMIIWLEQKSGKPKTGTGQCPQSAGA